MWDVCNAHAKDVVENVCPYCGEHLMMNKRVFANHVRWCKKNPKHEEYKHLNSINSKKKLEERLEKELGKLKKFKVKCAKCGKEFEVEEREKKFPSKEKYFCSLSCANSRPKSEESKKKTSESLKKYAREHNKKVRDDIFAEARICEICGKEFHSPKPNQKTCSIECGYKSREIKKIKKKFGSIKSEKEMRDLIYDTYYHQCAFRFALNKFPKEFNFGLIEENGWYRAKNNGDNLEGVSRDHIFSVSKGFEEKIDPYYISHPANCQLLKHSDNISKNGKCNITIDELKKKIEEWNIKYGIYENKINYKLLNDVGLKIIS